MLRSITLVAVLAVPVVVDAENWPGFRGPTGQGRSAASKLPVRWGGEANENVLWSSPLTGEGHASPILWGERLFVCTARWPDDVADRKTTIPEHHVLCYDTTSGKRLWDTRVPPGPWVRSDFRSGPGGGYAAPTPVTDGDHVFVAFGSSVLAALDLEGNIAWRREIVPHTFDVTLGSSPVLSGDNVILFCAMSRKADSRLVAFGKDDGEPTWSTPLPETGFGHSTPLLIEANDRPQLIAVASAVGEQDAGLQSFDPSTGRRLWWCRAAGDASSPVFGEGLVYVDSGRGGPGVAVDPTGSGDVTKSHTRWRVPQVPGGIGSPVVSGKLMYQLLRGGVLLCRELPSGDEVYRERLPNVGSTWPSPIVDSAGRLYFATAGHSFVVASGRKFELLAENDLGDPNHASPAAAANRLFLVGTRKVYCIAGE